MNKLRLFSVAALLSVTLFSSSCNKDTEGCTDPNSLNYNPDATKNDGSCRYADAAPQLKLSTDKAGNVPGNEVLTTINISAEEGIKSLKILKNGVEVSEYPVVTFNGEKTASHNFKYVVEQLSVGQKVNFQFIAKDNKDKESAAANFEVTVTSTPQRQIVEVPEGDIETTTWTKDKIWRMNGFVRVQDGKTLTIEAGTLIIGDRETKATLIIQRGGKIMAEGTANEPIIFTSERAPGQREPGDWGGIVICGKAKNNQGENVELEGGYGGIYGGNNDNDNSGILKYVQINFAGTPINPNQEINSLTMGSVGSGTVIENIFCAYGLDDAFEWFGGTVNCKNLVAYRGSDDDFDVDFGYSGNVQFALGIRDFRAADQSGSNGFEVDNNGSGQLVAPYTSAIFSNVSIIGAKKDKFTMANIQFQNAMHLRRSAKIKIYNSFFTAYPNGLYIDGASTAAHATSNELQLRNVVLAGVDGWGTNNYGEGASNPKGVEMKTSESSFDIRSWFNTPGWGNTSLSRWQDAGIDGSIFDLGTPKLTPGNGSVLLNGASFSGLSGFENVNFRGAFGTTDWTQGWVDWNAMMTDYFTN